jgi:predicted transcriptional regulator
MDVDEIRRDESCDDAVAGPDHAERPDRQQDAPDPDEQARSLTASDIMSRLLLTVSPEQHVVLTWELLASAGVHHLPVVDNGRCLAVLDDRMLAREWVVGPLSRSERKVRELCTAPAPSVSPDTPVDRVARLMHLTGADAVTVNKDGEFVGLVTVHDLLAVLAGEPRRQPVMPGPGSPATFTLTPAPLHGGGQ